MKLRLFASIAALLVSSVALVDCVSDRASGTNGVDAAIDTGTELPRSDGATPVEDGGADTNNPPVDASGDGNTEPTPDGSFVSKLTFASTNTSPPGSMRVAYDSKGNIFVAFPFTGTTTLGSFALTAVGQSDLGIAKIDAKGTTVLWAKSFGTTGSDAPNYVAVDDQDNVYVAGGSEGTPIAFGATTLTRRSNRYMLWLAKFDGSTGDAIRAENFDSVGNGTGGGGCAGVAIRKGNLAIGCQIQGKATFTGLNGNPVEVTPPGLANGNGIVIALLEKDTFKAKWINGIGSDDQEFLYSIAVKDDGTVAFTGATAGVGGVALNGNGISKTTPVGPNGATGMAGLLSGTDGLGVWLHLVGGAGGHFYPFGCAFDGNDVLAVGVVGGSVTVVNKPLSGPPNTSSESIGIVRFKDDSTVGAIAAIGGSDAGTSAASAVAIDPWRNILVTGQYTAGGMDYDGGSIPDPQGTSRSGFLLKMNPLFGTIWVKGFTTGSSATQAQSWAVAASKTGMIAQSGSFKGSLNLGDNQTVVSTLNGGNYDVFVVQRAP
ncbi:MAG: hypothetical protein U0174_00775 [Polyangiaceae bacterium]